MNKINEYTLSELKKANDALPGPDKIDLVRAEELLIECPEQVVERVFEKALAELGNGIGVVLKGARIGERYFFAGFTINDATDETRWLGDTVWTIK